jgi:hypothetical protein
MNQSTQDASSTTPNAMSLSLEKKEAITLTAQEILKTTC